MMLNPIPNTVQTLLESSLSRQTGSISLQKQLYLRITEAIKEGCIPPGTRLPGTRQLSRSLNVARNTVIAVFEQLATEGLVLTSTRGSFVSDSLNLSAEELHPVIPEAESGYKLPAVSDSLLPLFSGMPALGHFPLSSWRNVEEKVLHDATSSILGYGDPAGEAQLREVIAGHLSMTRGVRCKPSQVFITSGLSNSMSIIIKLLAKSGDKVWIEDPGYWAARSSFTTSGLNIIPIPVDCGGINPESNDWLLHTPKLIYTTPNHQYPTGVVMSSERRESLVISAKKHNSWIIEDDYGSELRINGEPIVSMQGLISDPTVIYVGSFSKTIYPALRIGYIVLPEVFSSDQIESMLLSAPHGGNRLSQLTLADFISSGRYSKHIIKMKLLYKERQEHLIKSLVRYLKIPHQCSGLEYGLQLTLMFPSKYPDTLIAIMAKKYGMSIVPISQLTSRKSSESNGLVLGYGNTSPDLYDRLAMQLSSIINQMST